MLNIAGWYMIKVGWIYLTQIGLCTFCNVCAGSRFERHTPDLLDLIAFMVYLPLQFNVCHVFPLYDDMGQNYNVFAGRQLYEQRIEVDQRWEHKKHFMQTSSLKAWTGRGSLMPACLKSGKDGSECCIVRPHIHACSVLFVQCTDFFFKIWSGCAKKGIINCLGLKSNNYSINVIWQDSATDYTHSWWMSV